MMQDKFRGCLIGLAIGDALGGPVEEIPKHLALAVHRPITDLVGGGYHRLLPGQVTDDTEMALCLARSIAEKRGFDPADIAQRFVGWYEDNQIGAGGTTRAAINRLKQGYPWYDAANSEKCLQSLGNGSVMRCAPVAMYDALHSDELVAHSHDQGIITHPHHHCIDSVLFVNTLLAHLLCGDKKQEAYEKALDSIIHNTEIHQKYHNAHQRQEFNTSGEVKATVETALHSFLTTNSFEDALLKAVNMGGDADTRGAVTGAMVGALFGEKAIPGKWKYKLIDRHAKPIYHELVSLSLSLYELAARK